MSLQYIIDGCNIINHSIFSQHTAKPTNDPKAALLEFIRRDKLCGSPRNKITIVFDGYPGRSFDKMAVDIGIVFSGDLTADERIKMMLENSANPKNIIVVTDDKEIKFNALASGAKAMSVQEFIPVEEKTKEQDDSMKPELTYTQMHKINEEFRKIWLK